jgi:hypothetical protein
MYVAYLGRIFPDLLKIYGLYSQCISTSFTNKQNEHMIKPMKTVRRDILRLISSYVLKATDFTYFNNEFLPTLK